MTINQVCGAGQRSIHLAAQSIRCGNADVVIAGGQDSMTQAPHLLYGQRAGLRMGDIDARDSMLVDGLIDAFHGVHMGVTVESLAKRYQITRREQDEFALWSQQKAIAATESKKLAPETVTMSVPSKKQARFVNEDEHPSPNVSFEALARLKPVFDPEGGITAGNSSGLNDGAAAVLVVSERELHARRMKPLARIASYACAGVEPMDMGLGPVEASREALEKVGWRGIDLDLMEVNEAFAAQSIAVNRELQWDPDRINVNGGAIALGHPLAGSGCRIVVTLLHEMVRRDAKRGLATLCVGGGQGIAICLER
jgi:acetyl-CoA C-acetyltransferase